MQNYNVLVNELKYSQSSAVRAVAVCELAAWPGTTELLLESLNDSAPEVRAAVITRLAGRVPPALIISQLNDPAWLVRFSAANALKQNPQAEFVPALIKLIEQGFPGDTLMPLQLETLKVATRLIGRLGGRRATVTLENLIRRCSREQVMAEWQLSLWEEGLKALATSREPRAIRILLTVLERDLRPEEDRIIRAALARVSSSKGQAVLVAALKPRLFEKSEQGWLRQAVVAEALGKLGCAGAVTPLLKLVTCPAPQVRLAVAVALGQIKEVNQAVIVALKELTFDSAAPVRVAASYAIEELDLSRVVPVLHNYLNQYL